MDKYIWNPGFRAHCTEAHGQGCPLWLFGLAADVAGRWLFQPASTTYLAQAQPGQILLADSSRTVLFSRSKLKETMGKQRAMQREERSPWRPVSCN